MSPQNNPCQSFFNQFEACKNKAEELCRAGGGPHWECMQASPHSPGPVQDEELVARLVINPIHIDSSDGSLKLSLMSDVKDKGGSVQRLAYIAEAEILAEASERLSEKNIAAEADRQRTVHGTVTLPVAGIRKIITHTGRRAFGVYDTAKPADRAHADILMLTVDSKHEARSARQQLFELACESFKAC